MDFSSSDEAEVKEMTRSGRFYSDTAEKGKKVLAEGREVAEKMYNADGDVVLR